MISWCVTILRLDNRLRDLSIRHHDSPLWRGVLNNSKGLGNSDRVSPPSKILVPIDGSSNAGRALDAAIMLAMTYDAELTILNVIPTPGLLVEAPTGLGLPPTGIRQYYEQQEGNATYFVDDSRRICRINGLKNVKTEISRASKSIVEEIIELSTKRKIDLIVIGTRGLGGFRKLLLGSVSSGVVTHANCNVLVVR